MTDNLEASVSGLRADVSQQSKHQQGTAVPGRLNTPRAGQRAKCPPDAQCTPTCQQTGKQPSSLLWAAEIEVDGDVLNKLADPLLHFVAQRQSTMHRTSRRQGCGRQTG